MLSIFVSGSNSNNASYRITKFKFLTAAVACVRFINTLIGEFCEDVPFNRFPDEPHPNLQQSIPTMNLPGCPTYN